MRDPVVCGICSLCGAFRIHWSGAGELSLHYARAHPHPHPHPHAYAHEHIHTYARFMHMHMRMHMQMHMHMHMHDICTCTCTSTHTCTSTCSSACICTCTYAHAQAKHPEKRALELFAREFMPAATSMAPGTTGLSGGRPSPAPIVKVFSFLVPKVNDYAKGGGVWTV